jgi:hypothetical protein
LLGEGRRDISQKLNKKTTSKEEGGCRQSQERKSAGDEYMRFFFKALARLKGQSARGFQTNNEIREKE